jgi:hypothetical protein
MQPTILEIRITARQLGTWCLVALAAAAASCAGPSGGGAAGCEAKVGPGRSRGPGLARYCGAAGGQERGGRGGRTGEASWGDKKGFLAARTLSPAR